MNTVSTIPAGSITRSDNPTTRSHSRNGRYFFVTMSTLFLIMAVVGFTPSYQANYSGQIHLHWFAHVHGAIMTSWLLVFFTQGVLAAKGNFRFHRKLGLFSVALGVLVLLCMITASIRARLQYPAPIGDDTWDLILIELYSISLFGLFFTWGMRVRRKLIPHKRLLFFATLILLQAAVDRTRFLPGLGDAIYVRFIYLDTLIIPLVIYDLITTKRVQKITMICSTIIIAIQIAVSVTWGAPAWHNLWFNIYAPFVEKVVEVKLSDAQIDPVIGNYGNKDWKMTVSRDAGKIYLKLPDVTRFEMAPTSENEWFLRTMVWKVSFIKGADGSVIKIINNQPRITWEQPRIR